MKKAVFCVILIVVFLTACTDTPEPADTLRLPVRITVKSNGNDAVFTADIFESGCDITFDVDHSLAGTELHFRENGNTATAGGFTRAVSDGTFPAQEALIKAVRAIVSESASGVRTEDGIKYTIDEMTIMVYYNKDTELLTGIGTEENGRRFEFTVITLEPYETQSNGAG